MRPIVLISTLICVLSVVQGRGNLKEPKERGNRYSSDSKGSSSSSSSSSNTAPPVAIPHSVFDKSGNLVTSRFDYKYSLKHPFHVSDNKTVPFYKLTGSAYVQDNRVLRLTDDRSDMTGAVWGQQAVPYKEWQITVGFKASGESAHGGKGLALWYVESPELEGNAYGYRDKWTGLGIMMDSFDDDGKHNNPLIKGFLNDGYKTYMEDRDGEGQTFGACHINYRNSKDPYWVRITYVGNHLKVEHAHHGSYFETCFSKDDVSLPAGYYFGVTAQTTPQYPDQHEIYLIDVYQINPSMKNIRKLPEDEISKESDTWKKYEEFKDHYDHLQENMEQEEFGRYQNDDLHFLIARLEDNQHDMMEELQRLTRGSGSGNRGSVDLDKAVYITRFDELDGKIKALSDHLAKLTDTINGVIISSSGSGSSSGSSIDHKPILDKLQELNSETNKRIASLEDAADKAGKRTSDIHEKINSLTGDPIKTGVQHYTFSTILWWILGLLIFEIIAYGIYRYYQLKKDDSFKKFI